MIAYFRGLAVAITQTINPSQGAMIAVQAPFETWKHIMNKQNAEYPTNPVVIACYNSQSSFTLSGTHSMIHQMAIALKQANVEVHTLKIDVAYHSHHMKPVADVYEKLLRTILFYVHRYVIYSNKAEEMLRSTTALCYGVTTPPTLQLWNVLGSSTPSAQLSI